MTKSEENIEILTKMFKVGTNVGIGVVLGYLLFWSPSKQTPSTKTQFLHTKIAQIEEQAPVESTPLQQWQEIEREHRDVLYDILLTHPGEDSLIAVLGEMPQHLSYLDKWHPSKRISVGPRNYLFDVRPVLHQTADVPLSVRPDSFSLYLSLGAYSNESPLHAYHQEINKSASALMVSNEPYVNQIRDIEMAPFYESVRNPTAQDLEKLYSFANNHIPKFIVDAFYEQAVVSEIAHARRMIEAEPLVYDAVYSNQSYGQGYWNPIADPAHAEFIVQPDRYENGELQIPTKTNTGYYIHRGGNLILPEQWEKQSAFTKWLYRRGPQFIDNLEIMLDAYTTSNNADEFAQQVMQRIGIISNIVNCNKTSEN